MDESDLRALVNHTTQGIMKQVKALNVWEVVSGSDAYLDQIKAAIEASVREGFTSLIFAQVQAPNLDYE